MCHTGGQHWYLLIVWFPPFRWAHIKSFLGSPTTQSSLCDLLQLKPINTIAKSCSLQQTYFILFIMAGRGRYLLEPGFVYDDVNPTTPPVVGRVVEWPLPKTENQSYPSNALQTSPSPSNDPEPEPSTSSTSLA
jgi:hypothetical protein